MKLLTPSLPMERGDKMTVGKPEGASPSYIPLAEP